MMSRVFETISKWLAHHPSDTLIFKDLESLWDDLKPVYNTDFARLVYGPLPKGEEILQSLNLIREGASKVDH